VVLRSGDLGHIDDDGYLFVEDRVKDMILRAGENVYSAEVEAAIYEHPRSTRPRSSDYRTSASVRSSRAPLMLKPGEHLSEDELRVHLQTRLANFKVPTRVSITSSPLRRNAAGKFVKREMPGIYFP